MFDFRAIVVLKNITVMLDERANFKWYPDEEDPNPEINVWLNIWADSLLLSNWSFATKLAWHIHVLEPKLKFIYPKDLRNFVTQSESEETEGEDTDELKIPTKIETDKEALDYVEAAAARHLGLEYGPLFATDQSWSGLKNWGALVKAAQYVEENIYRINMAFNKFHKNEILVSGVQIHKRTIDFILKQDD